MLRCSDWNGHWSVSRRLNNFRNQKAVPSDGEKCSELLREC